MDSLPSTPGADLDKGYVDIRLARPTRILTSNLRVAMTATNPSGRRSHYCKGHRIDLLLARSNSPSPPFRSKLSKLASRPSHKRSKRVVASSSEEDDEPACKRSTHAPASSPVRSALRRRSASSLATRSGLNWTTNGAWEWSVFANRCEDDEADRGAGTRQGEPVEQDRGRRVCEHAFYRVPRQRHHRRRVPSSPFFVARLS